MLKLRERIRTADLIIGPDLDGAYKFNMNNITFVGLDSEGNVYQLDSHGSPSKTESAYFDEENVLVSGPSFEAVKDKLDRQIQKKLIWVPEKPATPYSPPTFICLGIK